MDECSVGRLKLSTWKTKIQGGWNCEGGRWIGRFGILSDGIPVCCLSPLESRVPVFERHLAHVRVSGCPLQAEALRRATLLGAVYKRIFITPDETSWAALACGTILNET